MILHFLIAGLYALRWVRAYPYDRRRAKYRVYHNHYNNNHSCELLHLMNRLLLEKLTVAHLVNSQPFMEHKRSLPWLQEPTIGRYHQTNKSSPHPPLYFLRKIHFNIILPLSSVFSEWSLQFRFSDQNVVCIYHNSHTCWMSRPSHTSRLNHWRVQTTISLSNTFNIFPSLNSRDQISHPFKILEEKLF